MRLHVADYGVYPHCQLLIPDDGGMFGPDPFLHGNHIITVGREFLKAVGGDTFSALFLEGCGEASAFFLALFSVRAGETSKVAVQGFNCLSGETMDGEVIFEGSMFQDFIL